LRCPPSRARSTVLQCGPPKAPRPASRLPAPYRVPVTLTRRSGISRQSGMGQPQQRDTLDLGPVSAAAVDGLSTPTAFGDEAAVVKHLDDVTRALAQQRDLAGEQWSTCRSERRGGTLRRRGRATHRQRRRRRPAVRDQGALDTTYRHAPDIPRNGRLVRRSRRHRRRGGPIRRRRGSAATRHGEEHHNRTNPGKTRRHPAKHREGKLTVDCLSSAGHLDGTAAAARRTIDRMP
jgi:hypothetical protein